MGIKDWWYGTTPVSAPIEPTPKEQFSAVFPIGSDYDTWRALTGLGAGYVGSTVSRAEAIRIPAIKRARDIFCRLGTLPLHALNASDDEVPRALLAQPEKYNGLTRSYTMSWTIDDVLFFGRSLWLVLDRDSTGFPTVVDRIPFGRYQIDGETGQVSVDGEKVSADRTILFLSNNDGLLYAGGGVIRSAITLEATAAQRISQPQAREYFRSDTSYDAASIADFLSDVNNARRNNVSGFLPPDIERIATQQPTSEEIQLAEARNFQILEISRLTGLAPHFLGVAIPGNSITYSNQTDLRRDLVDLQASPYLTCLEERLSLGDVTPNGQRVRFNMDSLLRANTKERMETYQIGKAVGAYTDDEIRALENRPPLTPAQKKALAPKPIPQPNDAPPGGTNGAV